MTTDKQEEAKKAWNIACCFDHETIAAIELLQSRLLEAIERLDKPFVKTDPNFDPFDWFKELILTIKP